MQDQRPIAFFNHTLSPRAQQKSVYERELMAIVLAVQKWRHYLLGNQFIVRTDQHSLKYLLERRIINLDYQKWVTKLLGFNFDIQFRPGLDNKATNALSRLPPIIVPSLQVLTIPYIVDLDQLATRVQQDPHLRTILKDLLANPLSHPEFTLYHGHLFYKNRLAIPPQFCIY